MQVVSNKMRKEELKQMKLVAFIPIKLNNERIPGKNIKPFSDGTPLLHFIQESLMQLKEKGLLDEVYCFCSDERVQEYLLRGVKFLKRPEWLNMDTAIVNDLIREFIKAVDADYYVMAHATAPFIKTESIERCIDAVVNFDEYDSAFTVERIQTFIWENEKPVNFDLNQIPRTQDLRPIYMETSGVYVFSHEVAERYGRRVGIRPCLIEVEGKECIDIDTKYDMEIAQAIYQYNNQ